MIANTLIGNTSTVKSKVYEQVALAVIVTVYVSVRPGVIPHISGSDISRSSPNVAEPVCVISIIDPSAILSGIIRSGSMHSPSHTWKAKLTGA